MSITVQSADGNLHEFPDETDRTVIDKAMEDYSKKSSMKTETGMEAGGRFMQGVIDPVYGARQLYGHAVGSDEDAAKIDKEVQDREEMIKRRSGVTGFDSARAAGQAVPAIALGAATLPFGGEGLAPVVASGMAGAGSNLLMPVTSGNYIEQKIQQGLIGAAFGLGGAGVAKGIGSVVGPTVRESAKALMDKGITLTPGQIAGGVMRRAEEAAKSFPVLGTFIRGAEGRSVETFNRATINQALEPIGVKLPPTAKMGHEAISYAKLRLDEAYDNLLPKMQLAMDTDLASDISNVRYMASELPKAQNEQFETILRQRVAKYFTDTGAIKGERLKSMESELNSIASTYRSSSDAAQRELARSIDDVKFSIRDALQRQNPALGNELKMINSAYAMFTRVESAAARKAGSQGVFTPSDLLQSIKTADKSVRKGAFARGDALMQDFAEFADTVLPSKLPDSGTTERAMWDMLGIGMAGGTAAVKPALIPVAGAAVAPYTKMGQGVVNKIAQPGPARQAVGQAIQKTSPVSSGAASPFLRSLLDTQE